MFRNFNQFPDSGHGVLSLCHGSGTDAIAAALEGMNCLGIEKDKLMCQYASGRIKEFYTAASRLAAVCAQGAVEYDDLIGFANTLRQESERARQAMLDALVKFLSNMKPLFFSDTYDEDPDVSWLAYKLRCRSVCEG